MEITNFDLQDMDDSTVLQCVNPFDISPINGAETLYSPELSEEKAAPRVVKLEMEEFSDLAPYLSKKSSANCADELNTPIIEIKGPFEFMVHESINIQSPSAAPAITDPFNKFEYETISSATATTANSVKQLNDFSVYSNSNIGLLHHHHHQEVNMREGSEVQIFQSTNTNDLEDIFLINNNNNSEHIGSNNNNNNNDDETPASTILTELLQQQQQQQQQQDHHQISASSLFKYEDNHSVVSVINDNQYSNISSTSSNDDEYYRTHQSEQEEANNLGIVTPEDSNSSLSSTQAGPSSSASKKYPKLNLDFGFSNSGNIHTPDVIDTVVSMESSFNILDYVSDKLVTTVNIEDIKFGTPSTSTNQSQTGLPSRAKSNKRKKRNYDDDDEEYLPPSKKASKARRRGAPAAVSPSISTSRTSNESDEDDDDDDDEADELFELKRGRPPRRRTSSFSSEHSGDVSKYRELRDKNNEASRKSRLKRKMKEQTLEKEMEELEEKNLKLSAQVEQLEKMVNNFRSNLFKIMLKK